MARFGRDSNRARLALYLDAVRSMRPRQIAWRARRLIPPVLLAAGIQARSPTPPRLVAAGLGRCSAPQSGPTEPPHEAGVFAGYAESRRFGDPRFWDHPSDGLLFRFHLHGFSPLAEYAAGMRTPEGNAFWARVVDSWLTAHDRPREPAWHPYPTSVRIISWSAAICAIEDWPADLRDRLATSLLRQARYLVRAVEHDIGGNHVLKNAAALAFAGALFPDSRLMQRGLGLLGRELALQVLPDGGHEERSTSYQREIVSDLADVRELLRRGGEGVPEWLDESITRMHGWLSAVSGPDARLPLLNDAWDGPPVGPLETAEISALSDSGYLVFRHGRDQLLFDAGPLCPPHLPPHAHADALSFVLWADGQALVVDPGSYAYSGKARDRFRSTAAHNTVEVDARDQCDFWGDFRVANLPNVASAQVVRYGELLLATSRHDGYLRLPEPTEHERTVVWWPGWGVVIIDRLLGAGIHAIRSRLHCAPDATPVRPDRLGPFEVRVLGGPTLELCEGLYSPFLGVSRPAPIMEMSIRAEAGQVFAWSLLRPGARMVEVSDQGLVVERSGKLLRAPSFPAKHTEPQRSRPWLPTCPSRKYPRGHVKGESRSRLAERRDELNRSATNRRWLDTGNG